MNSLLIVLPPVGFTLAAVIGDIVSYKSYNPRKGYSPNLPLWGLGFLFGVCVSLVYLTGVAAAAVLDPEVLKQTPLWPKLVPLLVPAALLALAVRAVSRICNPE